MHMIMCVLYVCVRVCVSTHRGGGALPEAGADHHRHLRGVVSGRHRLRGRLLQNQVCVSQGNIKKKLQNLQ